MALIDAFMPAEEKYRAAVMRETWGHTAPEVGRVYKGHIVFTLSDYGDYSPIRVTFGGLNDSPWFFEALMDFICEKAVTEGVVYRFDGTYRMDGNGHSHFDGRVRGISLE